MSEQRVVTGANLAHVLKEVLKLAMDGWVLAEDTPPEASFFNAGYIVTMERNEASVAAFKAVAEQVAAAPKLTRAEILAKARAARGKQQGSVDMAIKLLD